MRSSCCPAASAPARSSWSPSPGVHLGIHTKRSGIVNVDGFFDLFLRFMAARRRAGLHPPRPGRRHRRVRRSGGPARCPGHCRYAGQLTRRRHAGHARPRSPGIEHLMSLNSHAFDKVDVFSQESSPPVGRRPRQRPDAIDPTSAARRTTDQEERGQNHLADHHRIRSIGREPGPSSCARSWSRSAAVARRRRPDRRGVRIVHARRRRRRAPTTSTHRLGIHDDRPTDDHATSTTSDDGRPPPRPPRR